MQFSKKNTAPPPHIYKNKITVNTGGNKTLLDERNNENCVWGGAGILRREPVCKIYFLLEREGKYYLITIKKKK